MNEVPWPDFMQPQWFFPLFAGMWFGISALLSVYGGWARLGAQFRVTHRVVGKRFRFVSGSMGSSVFPVSYRSCLFVTVNETGFGLSIFFPFRLLSPPLFIPWAKVASVETEGFLFASRAIIHLEGGGPAISIRSGAGKGMLDAYGQVAGARAR